MGLEFRVLGGGRSALLEGVGRRAGTGSWIGSWMGSWRGRVTTRISPSAAGSAPGLTFTNWPRRKKAKTARCSRSNDRNLN